MTKAAKKPFGVNDVCQLATFIEVCRELGFKIRVTGMNDLPYEVNANQDEFKALDSLAEDVCACTKAEEVVVGNIRLEQVHIPKSQDIRDCSGCYVFSDGRCDIDILPTRVQCGVGFYFRPAMGN